MNIYLQLEFDKCFTVHRPGHKKSRSVEFLKKFFTVSEITVLIFIFLTVCDNSVMTYPEKVVF